MYAPTEELTRIANSSRDAVTAALNTWAEAAQRYAADFDARHPVPDAAETQAAIDTAYDLAGKLLAEQHALRHAPSSRRTRRPPRPPSSASARSRLLPGACRRLTPHDREPVRPPLGRALPVTAARTADAGPPEGVGPAPAAVAR